MQKQQTRTVGPNANSELDFNLWLARCFHGGSPEPGHVSGGLCQLDEGRRSAPVIKNPDEPGWAPGCQRVHGCLRIFGHAFRSAIPLALR
jgi:hypothetical protein